MERMILISVLNYFEQVQKYICSFYNLSALESLKFVFGEEKDHFIVYSQYHGCWWLSITKSQGISSHDIDLVLPDNFAFAAKGIQWNKSMNEYIILIIDWLFVSWN